MSSVRFALQMAWRQGRAARRRLLLLTASVVAGVAALVAVNSFTRNLTVFILFNVLEGIAVAISMPAKQAFLVQCSPRRWLGTVQGMEQTSMQLAAWIGTLTAPLLFTWISGYAIGVGGFLASTPSLGAFDDERSPAR